MQFCLDQELSAICEENDWQLNGDHVYISNQEENIKSKNINEKLLFDGMY